MKELYLLNISTLHEIFEKVKKYYNSKAKKCSETF